MQFSVCSIKLNYVLLFCGFVFLVFLPLISFSGASIILKTAGGKLQQNGILNPVQSAKENTNVLIADIKFRLDFMEKDINWLKTENQNQKEEIRLLKKQAENQKQEINHLRNQKLNQEKEMLQMKSSMEYLIDLQYGNYSTNQTMSKTTFGFANKRTVRAVTSEPAEIQTNHADISSTSWTKHGISDRGLQVNYNLSLSSLHDEMTTLKNTFNSIESVVEKLNNEVKVVASDVRTLVEVKSSELETKIMDLISHMLLPIDSEILENKTAGELVIQYDDRQDPVALSKMDVNAFRRIKNYTKTLILRNFSSSELDLGFLSGFNQLTSLKFENVHHVQKSLPTLPLLPNNLTSLELDTVKGLNDSIITFPTLPTGGLKTFRFLYSGVHTDASVSRILDWILISSAKTLETLRIASVGITEIPSQIASFTALEELDLFGNSLTTLKNGALRFSVPVPSLWLWHNKINSIEPGAFQGDFRHTYVVLFNNDLTRFDEPVFRPMLEQMISGTGRIDFNEIDCSTENICHLAWVIRNDKFDRKVSGMCSNGTYFSSLQKNGFNHCPATEESQ